MVNADNNNRIACHGTPSIETQFSEFNGLTSPNNEFKKRTIKAKPAAFGATEKKAVIGVGEALLNKWSSSKMLLLDCAERRVEVIK